MVRLYSLHRKLASNIVCMQNALEIWTCLTSMFDVTLHVVCEKQAYFQTQTGYHVQKCANPLH